MDKVAKVIGYTVIGYATLYVVASAARKINQAAEKAKAQATRN
jgi:hypothetical protein